MPAESANDTSETIKCWVPGADTARLCTDKCCCGRGSRTGGVAGTAVACKIPRSRAMPWRAATSCFQVPKATSMGASARPITIEEAIMIPPEACSIRTK